MQDLFRHLRIHCKTMKEDKKVAICWIHKIAMQEVEHEEPIPEYGIYTYKEYKCPMCMTTFSESDNGRS